jgi:hypothetical protein
MIDKGLGETTDTMLLIKVQTLPMNVLTAMVLSRSLPAERA